MVHYMQQKVLTHRSLEKALEILLAFLPHNAEMGTVELSEIVGFHRSTVNRLLHVLEKYGFVQQNPDTKKVHSRPLHRRSGICGSAVSEWAFDPNRQFLTSKR